MITSDKGIAIIKESEGLKLTAYKCPAGIDTIGYGHTGNVAVGEKITEATAEELLKNDLKTFEKSVNDLHLPLSQNQFDAIISFCYNLGFYTFINSSIFKYIKANPFDKNIRTVWNKYIYANKVVLPGLVARRKKEVELYFS
jgi:lysozyme